MIIAGAILWTVGMVILTLWVGAFSSSLYLSQRNQTTIHRFSPLEDPPTDAPEDSDKILEMSVEEFLEKHEHGFHDFAGSSIVIHPMTIAVVMMVELAIFITGGVLIAAS